MWPWPHHMHLTRNHVHTYKVRSKTLLIQKAVTSVSTSVTHPVATGISHVYPQLTNVTDDSSLMQCKAGSVRYSQRFAEADGAPICCGNNSTIVSTTVTTRQVSVAYTIEWLIFLILHIRGDMHAIALEHFEDPPTTFISQGIGALCLPI